MSRRGAARGSNGQFVEDKAAYNNFDDWWISEPNTGCWLWLGGLDKDGYGWIALPKLKHARAHRFNYERIKGQIPFGFLVLHKCDMRSCVNPDHLFVGTQKDNQSDAVKKWRHSKQKFSEATLLAVRTDPRSHRKIAAAYSISKSHVGWIKQRNKES
jgi:hypothetical protein